MALAMMVLRASRPSCGVPNSAVQIVALLLVGLIVGVCVATSVDAASVEHHDCAALTTALTALSKPAPMVSAVSMAATDSGSLLVAPSMSALVPPPVSEASVPALCTGPLPSRSPPSR